MKYFIAILILIVPTLAYGVQTCNPGYYKLSPDSECTMCPSNGYYCPDDDTDDAISCPADTTDWNPLLEECGYHPLNTIYTNALGSWGGPNEPASEISNCFALNGYTKFQEGTLNLQLPFNPARGDYWTGCWRLFLFYSANPGYYLSQFNFISSKTWYFGIKPCTNEHPENSHYSGPGTPDEPVKDGKTDYNDCPWACDDGYVLRDGECVPLCTAGATEFHVGDYVFNIYADKLTTPAINIALGNGTVCYVPLVNGSGKGLNVDYHGTVYHTSD